MLRVLCLTAALATTVSAQTTQVVTSTADSGAGSLRSAIGAVNAAGGGRIEFAIPGDGVHTITLQSNLPDITVPVEIDGLSQPGATCDPLPTDLRIQIDGLGINLSTQGVAKRFIWMSGGASVVRGLSFFGGGGNGQIGDSTFLKAWGDGNLIECNLIGIRADGGPPGASGTGISVSVPFGSTGTANDNVIVRNVTGAPAIALSVSGDRNRVQGNRLGWTGPDALTPAATAFIVLLGVTGDDTLVGGAGDGEGNIVGGNLSITGTGHVVEGNWVGLDANGDAVDVTGRLHVAAGLSGSVATDMRIGGSGLGAGNVAARLEIDAAAERITVQGNRFGTDASGMALHPQATTSDIDGKDLAIGGAGDGEGNQFVSAADEALSAFRAERLMIEGNLIGTDATGLTRLGVGEARLSSGTGNRIGGAAPGSGNVIATELTLSSETAPVVQRNHIGVNAAGLAAFEGAEGISVFRGEGALIGGASGEGNVVTGDFTAIGLSTTTGARVLGNRVGVDAAATRQLALPFSGISLFESSDNEIGGTEPGAGNVLGGSRSTSASNGAIKMNQGSDRNRILGNWIGTDPAQQAVFRFEASGIVVDSSYQNVIGLPEAPNVVAHTDKPAVYILDLGTGNAVSGLLAFDTGVPIVDLDGTPDGGGTDGTTENDAGDGDEGPNRLQNAPAITAASATDTEISVTYSVDTAPGNATYPLRVEAFAVAPDGAVYLGFEAISESEAQAQRTATFDLATPLGPGTALFMTATDADGNTGESSEPRGLTPPVATAGGPGTLPFAVVASPNPARDRLAVTVVSAGDHARVEVFDALGRRVAWAEPPGASISFDVSALAPGAYVVRAVSNGRVATRIVTITR